MASSLDDHGNSCKEMSFVIEKQEKRVRYLETMTMKLVISYVFFQSCLSLKTRQSHAEIGGFHSAFPH